MYTMMMLYIGGQWFFLKQKIYLNYFFYILSWILYFVVRQLILKPYQDQQLDDFLRVFLPMISYICYFNFFLDYTSSFNLNPKLIVFVKRTRTVLIVYLLTEPFFAFCTPRFIHEYVHIAVRIFLIVASLITLWNVAKIRNTMANYFIIGTSLLLIGAITSMVLTMFTGVKRVDALENIFLVPLFYLKCGLIGELIFYSLGLAYRQRKIEQQKIIAEQALINEKTMAELNMQKAKYDTQEAERNRMANEMHDDLGSGLSTIRLLAETATYTKDEDEIKKSLHKISTTSIVIIQSMREIIWSMSANSQQFDELISYTKNYLFDYLDTHNIVFNLQTQKPIPTFIIDSTYKRNVYLVLKECAHNAVKYSKTAACDFKLLYDNNFVYLSFADNGIGLNKESKSIFGNGFKNMEERIKTINGIFKVEHINGLTITISLPIIKD